MKALSLAWMLLSCGDAHGHLGDTRHAEQQSILQSRINIDDSLMINSGGEVEKVETVDDVEVLNITVKFKGRSSFRKTEDLINAKLKSHQLDFNKFQVGKKSNCSEGHVSQPPSFPVWCTFELFPRQEVHIVTQEQLQAEYDEHKNDGESLLEVGEQSLQFLEDVDGSNVSDMSDAELGALDARAKIWLHEEAARRRKTNGKQKKWAAKMLARLEKTVCLRGSTAKNMYVRSCRSHDYRPVWDHRGEGWHCSGWDNTGVTGCCQPCRAGYNGMMSVCVGCSGSYMEGPFACWEPCGEGAGLPHLADNCATMYCSKDTGTCAAKAAEIALAIGSLIANMLPGAQGLSKVVSLARKGAISAAKAALKSAMKSHIEKLLRKFKTDLVKHMKKEAKNLKDEVVDNILEDGGEGMIAGAVSANGGDAAELAAEMAKDALVAADPTGIADVISSFSAEGCGEQRMTEMPDDGLDNS